MNTYQPLSCDMHDYLEIACMYGYRLQVERIDGCSYAARALTTRTAASKEEFLLLARDSGQCEVRLDQLLAISPLGLNVSFGRIELVRTE